MQDSQDLIFFKIKGFSMEPFFKSGDTFIVKKTQAKDLKLGDIISYYSDDHEREVCHRLIKKVNSGNAYCLYTRGDAFSCLDQPIDENALLGKVIAVVKNGKIINLTGRRQEFNNRLIVFFLPWLLKFYNRLKSLRFFNA